MNRQFLTAGLVAAAVGGPYVATETEFGRSMTGAVQSISQPGSESGPSLASKIDNAHYDTELLWDRQLGPRNLDQLQTRETQRLVGGPVNDFRDLLRFDITPDWVTSHFTRVTTVLSELRMEGLRVPVVTGTRPDDVAGSVTYFFRHDQQLQRVVLHGFTGDPNRLVQSMMDNYGMKHRPTLDSGVYTIDWNGSPTSVLKVTRAPVVYADATHNRHTVFLELNQPHVDYGLSAEAQRIVQSDWSTGRW